MRRIKLIGVVGFVMVAMLALTAGPAMADEFEDEFFFFGDEVVLEEGDLDDDEVVFLDEDDGLFDALCSPGIDIDLDGCLFSDEEDDDLFDDDNEIDFVSLDDDDLFDDDDRHDNDNNDNERSFTRIIDRD